MGRAKNILSHTVLEYLSAGLWSLGRAHNFLPSPHSSPPTILENISNVHTAGTKTHTEPPLTPAAGPGSLHLDSNTSHVQQVRNSDSTWAIFLSPCQRKCPSSGFLIILDRPRAPLPPQTQILVWALKTLRTSPLLTSGSGRWWKWRKRRVRATVVSAPLLCHGWVQSCDLLWTFPPE